MIFEDWDFFVRNNVLTLAVRFFFFTILLNREMLGFFEFFKFNDDIR